MSRFFSPEHRNLKAYVPGEQPQDRSYIKLNTNESPFPPFPGVRQAAEEACGALHLYPDPECTELREAVAREYGVEPDQVIMTNGSDEVLSFAFLAFGSGSRGFAFPDITYGFYPVFAELYHIPWVTIPLREDLTVVPEDYIGPGHNVVLANPNAPTGLQLSLCEIEKLLRGCRDSVVIVDEAYVDFGGESCIPLIRLYDNLLVTRTFSKSCSLAGGRLGFGVGSRELIADLNTVRYSTNPYNVDRMTMAAGLAVMKEMERYRRNCEIVTENREYAGKRLRDMGFSVTDSRANFLFASHPALPGDALYRKLRERGILIRRFALPRIENYSRITVGSREQMDVLLESVTDILKEERSS